MSSAGDARACLILRPKPLLVADVRRPRFHRVWLFAQFHPAYTAGARETMSQQRSSRPRIARATTPGRAHTLRAITWRLAALVEPMVRPTKFVPVAGSQRSIKSKQRAP